MCGMKAQRQVCRRRDGYDGTADSARALLCVVSRKGLTNGVRCARVAGMKTRPNTGGAVAVVVQPELSVILLSGVAGKRLASGVRSARVCGMKEHHKAGDVATGTARSCSPVAPSPSNRRMLDKLFFVLLLCCGMMAQRKAGGVAAEISQPGSFLAVSSGVSGECLTSRFFCASVTGMKTHPQQRWLGEPRRLSLRLLSGLRRVAWEWLATGVRCASVVGVKARPSTDGAVAGVVQPAPSASLLSGVAGGKRLASGVRCASVVDINKSADMFAKNIFRRVEVCKN